MKKKYAIITDIHGNIEGLKSVLDNIKTEIVVKEQKISILRIDNKEYISLTDLAKYVNKEDPSGVIRNWMPNKKFI